MQQLFQMKFQFNTQSGPTWRGNFFPSQSLVTKKVLTYEGRKFVFSCWNSDRMEIVFYRMLDGSTLTAKIK